MIKQYRAELRQGLNELAGHDPLDQATQSLITLFEDYTKEIVGDYEITEENQDNGHDCYEKFCDYCDKGTRDDFRQTINQTSKTILRGSDNE